ncbi:MAG: hypothetical protein JWP66_1229 [Naasia sp.]|nr:hypothetical protein [Naasia sp.]
MRRTWPALLLIVAVAATLGWLALGAPGVYAWGVYGFWAAIAVAIVVRVIAAILRRRSKASAPGSPPAARSVVPTARPGLEPVVQGPDTSPITMVGREVLDPFEQQLGQLRHRDDRRP